MEFYSVNHLHPVILAFHFVLFAIFRGHVIEFHLALFSVNRHVLAASPKERRSEDFLFSRRY